MADNTPFDGRTPQVRVLEKQMREAVGRDNIAYVFACNNLGRNPDYRDLYEQGVAELMQRRERVLEDRVYQNVIQAPQQTEPDYRGKTTKINYAEFLRLVDSSFVKPYDSFDESQYSEKMRILRDSGYDKLTIAQGKSIPIGDVSVSRVLHAFSKTYQTAMNWAKKEMEPKTKKTQQKLVKRKPVISAERKKADTQPLLFPTEGKI